MFGYLMRRLLLIIPTLLCILLVNFFIVQAAPGGPVEQAISAAQGAAGEAGVSSGSDESGVEIPASAMKALNEHYHFDKPLPMQYILWLGDILTLDLGTSYKYNKPVLDLIVTRFPISIYFGLTGFILAYLVCIPLGIIKAVRHAGYFDFVSSAIVLAGYSIPGWALGAVLLVLALDLSLAESAAGTFGDGSVSGTSVCSDTSLPAITTEPWPPVRSGNGSPPGGTPSTTIVSKCLGRCRGFFLVAFSPCCSVSA
mgnify:CR=1 FL=1